MTWLDEPVKVWHLIVLAVMLAVALGEMRKQLTAIGKSVWHLIDKFEPSDLDN